MLTACQWSLRLRWTRVLEGRPSRGRCFRPTLEAAARTFLASAWAKLDDTAPSSWTECKDRASTYRDGTDERKRNVKKVSHTPLVLNALIRRGRTGVRPRARAGKIDLQYVSPFQHAILRASGREATRRSDPAWREARLASPSVTHKSILANYVEQLDGADLEKQSRQQQDHWIDQLGNVFHQKAVECLGSTGFHPVDVVRWAWVLSAKNSLEAAKRLHAISNRPLAQGEAATPTFLLQLTLLRPVISTAALRVLLFHASDRLSNTPAQDWRRDILNDGPRMEHRLSSDTNPSPVPLNERLDARRPYPGLTETAVITLTIRLLRHARKVWPMSLPYIARLFTQHVTGRLHRKPIQHAQLSFVYNRILFLLSLPSDRHFKQIVHHQEAQFTVIRAMSEFEPPLLVDRLGYRSVVSIQLAHAKTPTEIRWAARKATSWPPWQEHRLGLDEDIAIDSGKTRAGLALSQLAESGYGTTSWEDAATVLSGWDTDNSPTIQTRRVLPATPPGTLDLTSKANQLVWGARIRATRTVEEAWAVFLSCQDASCESEEAYTAIAEKLLAKTQSVAMLESTDEHVNTIAQEPQPGDNPEPMEAPLNPRKRPYLRIPVPTPDQLLEIAGSRGQEIGVRLLTCVLERSCPYYRGERLIKQSSLPQEIKNMVLGLAEPKFEVLQQIDKRVLLAILRWSTLEYSPEAVALLGHETYSIFDSDAHMAKSVLQVTTAFRLVSVTQAVYPPAWTPLFRALTPPAQKRRYLVLARRGLLKMVQLISEMENLEVDRTWGQFAYLCRTFSLTRIAALKEGFDRLDNDQQRSVAQIPDVSTSLVKREFEKLVGSHLPTFSNNLVNEKEHTFRQTDILQLPKSHELYMLIQSLGLAEDYKGILETAYWLQLHWTILKERQDYSINSRKLRRCFIAIRAFLEDNWRSPARKLSNPIAGVDDLCSTARRIVVDIGGEEAWPTDEEVDAYGLFELPPLWPHT